MAARQYRSTVEAKTLSVAINNSVTTMTLNSVTTLPSTYQYTLVIDPDTATEEIVTVTASAGGNSLTIVRGIDGTSAQAHAAAAVVKHMITARDLQEPQDHIAATSAVHGVTGSVVGTTDTQTLTNKTVNLTSNTLTGTTAQFNTALSDGNFATISGTETLTAKTLTSPVVTGGTLNGGVALTVDSTELNILDGATLSTAELNLLDGVVASTAELNFVDGVTSAIQTQLNAKAPTASPTFTGTVNAAAITATGDISGAIVSGVTSAGAGRGLHVRQPSGDGSDAILQFTNNASTSQLAAFNASSSGALSLGSTTAFWGAVYNNTVSGSANVQSSSDGQLRRLSSSAKYKKDIETLDHETADKVLELRPVWFKAKESNVDNKEGWSYVGLIAEEVAEIEPRLVFYKTVEVGVDESGNQTFEVLETPIPEGVQYEKLSVYLLDVVKREKARSNDLEQRLIALEAKVAELEAK
jgi:hypothetical protein